MPEGNCVPWFGAHSTSPSRIATNALILVCGLGPWYRKRVLVISRLRLQGSPKDEWFIIAIPLLKNQIEFEPADKKRKHWLWSVHRIRILCYPGSPIQFIRLPPRHYFWVLLKLIGKSWTTTSQNFSQKAWLFASHIPSPSHASYSKEAIPEVDV